MKKITILVPAYNEHENIHLIYTELCKNMDSQVNYEWELLFVNDGSKDSTLIDLKLLREKDNRVCFVDLSRNFGKEAAMCAGLDYSSGDCVIIMDADLQHPPSVIPSLISCWEEGYDDVYAQRLTRGKEGWVRKKLSLIYYTILQKLSKVDILPNVGDFRLLDRSCVNVLNQLRETERYTKGLYCWIGFNKKAVGFEQADRIAGTTSWNFIGLLNLAIEGITSYTISPLRISTVVGVIFSFISFIYLIFILIKTILYGEQVQGFPTIIIIVLFLGGLQLLSLGILGEYIGRIFNETKKRPPYIAKEYNNTKLHK